MAEHNIDLAGTDYKLEGYVADAIDDYAGYSEADVLVEAYAQRDDCVFVYIRNDSVNAGSAAAKMNEDAKVANINPTPSMDDYTVSIQFSGVDPEAEDET